eukprot:3790287-Amphidinium_carterae.1
MPLSCRAPSKPLSRMQNAATKLIDPLKHITWMMYSGRVSHNPHHMNDVPGKSLEHHLITANITWMRRS